MPERRMFDATQYFVFCLIISLIQLCLFEQIHGETKVQHVHVLFRHGSRAPIAPFPNDGHENENIWSEGLGNLDPLGVAQAYRLGEFIRRRYKDYLPENYNSSDLYVRSTDVDRTLQSAMSLLAGLYPVTKANSPLAKYGVHWAPIPVHTVPVHRDHLLLNEKCPRAMVLLHEQIKTPAIQSHLEEHTTMFAVLSEKSGLKKVTPDNLWTVEDNIVVMKTRNVALPDWLTPHLVKEIKRVQGRIWAAKYSGKGELLRLQTGAFVNNFIENMDAFISHRDVRLPLARSTSILDPPMSLNEVVNGTTNDPDNEVFLHRHIHDVQLPKSPKLVLYSAHDTNMSPLFSALGINKKKQPPYASAIFLELLGPDEKTSITDFRVRVFYKEGDHDNKGTYLGLPPCEDESPEDGCPYDKVKTLLKAVRLKPKYVKQACHLEQQSTHVTIKLLGQCLGMLSNQTTLKSTTKLDKMTSDLLEGLWFNEISLILLCIFTILIMVCAMCYVTKGSRKRIAKEGNDKI